MNLNKPTRASSTTASVSLALRTLRARFGPAVSIQHLVECGVRGARVLQREGGRVSVLATCFSGAPEDRAQTAALWALDGVSR